MALTEEEIAKLLSEHTYWSDMEQLLADNKELIVSVSGSTGSGLRVDEEFGEFSLLITNGEVNEKIYDNLEQYAKEEKEAIETILDAEGIPY